MVLEALETMSGHPVLVDDDGDIPLPTGEVKSWLRILPTRPTLEFFGTVVEHVTDLLRPTASWRPRRCLHRDQARRARHLHRRRADGGATAFSRHNVAAGIGQWLQFVEEVRPEIVAALTHDACGPDL